MRRSKWWHTFFGRNSDARASRPDRPRRPKGLRSGPLSLELLEDRIAPHADALIHLVPPEAAPEAMLRLTAAEDSGADAPQVFFLATGGADGVVYHGPITVGAFDVPAFAAPAGLEGQQAAVLDSLLRSLNAAFPATVAEFTLARPAVGEFSTIYLGGDGSPFAAWGSYYGLAEQVDEGNRDRCDNAFVFSAAIDATGLTAAGYGQRLAEVVAHEAGHLLGAAHADDYGHDPDDPLANVAFKPYTHVESARDARADLIADGKVTLAGVAYPVHPKIVEAVRDHEAFYYAGTVGPDGFPDLVMGQGTVHPEDNATWLTRILDMAWAAQNDDSFSTTEKSQILAFAYGFLTHSAGDHWAHTLVNDFAEGVFPDIAEVVGSVSGEQRELANALRHFLVEGYVGDTTRAFDHNPDRTVLPDGDVSDDSTPGIPFDSPIRFLYETLIRPFPADPSPVVGMAWEDGTLRIEAGNTFVRTAGSFVDDGFVVGHKVTTRGFTNAANNGTFFVTAVTATELTVAAALVNETAGGDEEIVVKVPFNTPTTINVDAAANAFVRAAGSFRDDGFVPGQRFTVYGFSAYHGDYLVQSISADGKTLVVRQDLQAGDEIGTGDEQLVVQGSRGKLLNLVFKLRDIIENAALDAGPRLELGGRVGDLLDNLAQGTLPSPSDLSELYRAYLYNWVDELNEGLRNWGKVGLALTRALFDPQSRRDLQNKLGERDGPDTLTNALRAATEGKVGVLDVLMEELDDPNGDGATTDSFVNKHLLPMFGLPEELGVLRAGLQAFGSAISDLLAPISGLFNPIEAGILQVKEFVKDYVKDQIEERFGFSFEAVEFLTKTNSKMDLASITVGGTVVPVFKPGDHERLDAYLGLPAGHHQAFPARLTVDVNAALAAAGLGTRLRAEATGSVLRLVAIDPTITGFSITAAAAANPLGFDAGQASTAVGGAQALTAARAAPGNGRIDASVTFDVSINGGAAVAVTITAASTADNETVGNEIELGGVTFTFFDNPEGAPLDPVEFNETTFAAYANTVTLSKMLLLMEDPGQVGGGPGTVGAGQLSALYSNVLGVVNGVPVPYDFKRLNLNGAHGGNVLTSTLPGVPGTAGRPWLNSIDEDHGWRIDSATTTTALFRISTSNDAPVRPAVWETPVAAGTYNVYATWQGNVTQTTDNLDNSNHPDQHILPATNATYTISVDGVAQPAVVRNQRLFADDIEDGGLAFELIGTVTFAADGTLRVELSNVADGHVVAGPVLLVPTAGGPARRVQAVRDPETLVRSTPSEYTDDPSAWTDLVYATGTGNDPLWESQRLRPVFRHLFNDWQNGPFEFPSLGDSPSPDPNLPSLVLFDTAEFALDDGDRFILKGFVDFLKANPSAHATIHGFTDTVGDPGDNLTLSENRANAVASYLTTNGIAAARLTIDWFGEDPAHLFFPTDDEVSELRNRRVELTVVVDAAPLPSHATPFGPAVPDNDLKVPIPDSLKNLILDGVNNLVSLAETVESAPPLNVTLPVLDKSLADLLNLSGNLDQTVRQPIVTYFNTDTSPTVHELFDVIRASIGGRMDTFSAILEFDVDLRKTFSVDNLEMSLGLAADAVGLELGGRLDVDAVLGFVDALADDLPKLTLGVDLTPGGSIPVAERVYIKADRVLLSADIHASNLDFGARFGFLGVGVVDGEVNLNTDVTLTFDDPNDDGKITLAEIAGTPLDTLIHLDFAGTLDGNLPIEVSGLPGFLESSIGTVVFGATDVFDLSTYAVDFDGNFDRVFSFNNIDAASLVGLLGQLTFWMDEFRRGDEFSALDVPLVGPSLDRVLGVADAFRDKLLLDDNDNGLDDARTLLFDLNAALDAAGLGDRIRAENSGGKIRLVSNDATVGQFHVAGGAGLGFDANQSSSGSPTDLFESITAAGLAPALGKLAADVTFTITIDGESPVSVTVEKTDTDDNTAVGDDRWKLVNADNAATFSTVQEMILKLTEIFNISDLVYHPEDQTLTWSLNLAETFGQLDLPLGFSLDELPAFLQLQTSGNVRIVADGQLNLTLGVFLGPAEPSTMLDGTELLTELNGGIDVPTDQRITGANAVRTVYGQLSADAKFALAVNGGSPVNVTVTKAAAADNETAQDLADDFNAALAAAGLGAQVQAQTVADTPGQQRVKLVGLGGVISIQLTATTSDPTVKDIGFAAQQPATGEPATAELVATRDLPALRGRLTGDASFAVSLDNVNGGTPFTIEVLAASTATNRFAFDIVGDVQAALDAHEALRGKIEVGFSDGRLTFTAKNGASELEISGVNTVAAGELGLTNTTGNSVDFVITVRGGGRHEITLDDAVDLNDVIAEISSQTSGQVTAVINDRGTGLTLFDNTFHNVPPGTGKFQVLLANNSTAAVDLGILQSDAPEAEVVEPGEEPEESDGVIEGTDIAGLTPLDRFFLQATPASGPALASVGVDISTPTPLTATARFGFVGLTLEGGGALPSGKALEADLSLRLNEPAGSTDGRVSLAELINSLDDVTSLLDLSLTGAGKVEFDLVADSVLTDLGIDVGADARIAVAVDLGDVFGDPPIAPTLNVTFPDFSELLDFGNLEFNFQTIIAGLRALTGFLDQFEAFDFLDKPLPIVGVNLGELIAVADKFAVAVEEARANPAGTVQVLEDKLKQAFGLPPASNAINLVLVNDDNGTPSTADDFRILKFEFNLAAGFNESVGLDFDLGVPGLELGGGADLTAAGSAGLQLAVGFNIADPTQVFLFDSTALEATLDLGGDGLAFRAAVGPLGVFVNGGSIDLHGTVQPGGKLFRADFGELEYVNHRVQIDFGDLGALLDGFTAEVGGAIAVQLPVFFPTDSIQTGTVLFDANLGYSTATGEFTHGGSAPHAVDGNGNPIPLSQLFAFNPAKLSLLDQLLLGVDGVDLFLEGLQDVLDGDIGGVKLPLIGDKLAGAADVVGDFRDDFIEDFRQALEALANPGAAFVAAGDGADPVSTILFDLLGPGGINLLLDTNGSGAPDVGDITFVSNFDDPNVAPADVTFDWDFKLGSTLVDVGAGIGFDIGIPGLGLETTGAVHLDIDWELALGFGLNVADGFYLDIADGSELELNVDVTVPGVGITGTLGFLQVQAFEDVDPSAPDPVTHLGATFAVDIKNRNDTTQNKDPRLGFSEIGRIGIDVKVGADAVADLAMRLSLSSDLVPDAPTNFPSVVADFLLDWRLGDRAAGVYVPLGELDGNFLSNGLQFIGFEHVGLDLGTYFTNLIGPIVETVQDVTEPVKPFLDFLTEPIPVISQLAGPTSLLDIAAMSGLVNPGIIKAIEVVDQVIDISHSIQFPAGGNVILYFDRWLPSLVIYDASNPPSGGLLDLTNPNLDLDQLADDLLGGLPPFLPEDLDAALGEVAGNLGSSVKKMLPGGSASGGFELPIIDNPASVFGMLLGQPADLVTFTMDALELEAEFSAFFSIFGPLGVSINAEFAAQFGPFKFGYDTFGISEFASSGFRNPLLLFDGLYVSDLDVATSKEDVPELQFDAGLWAAAELNLGIARAGVAGGLFAEIDFDLHDPDRDGRVRVKEIVTNVLNEFRYGNPALSPLAMFDITGQLTARLFAFLKIKLGFFKLSKEFNITPPIVLLDFASNFERFPTLATELPGGVLQLNMGKFSAQRIEGDLSDLPEEFHVKQDGPGHVLVWAPSLGVDEGEAQRYEVTSTILGLGGEGDDVIDLHLVTDNLQYELEGNAGNDTIKTGSGTGAAKILGGAGNDTLWGGGGADLVFGETGADEIRGGGGRDWLFGDGDAKDSILGHTITVAVKANDGADSVFGDAGEDILFGAGGGDTLEGGTEADVLIGDGGKVTVGPDRLVVTSRSLLPVPEADPGRLELAVEDTSKGTRGAGDVLRGDGGNDHLYGGVGNDELFGGGNDDVIYGETGLDAIDAGDGHDVVFGDFGTFVRVNGLLEPVTTVGGESDVISGGTGNDKLLGGAGHDLIHGDNADGTGTGDDWVWGGTGLDTVHGDAGDDHLYGNADPDKLYGNDGNDYLEGGGSDDLMLGGIGLDLLVGGYGSDTMDGEADSDTYRITARGGAVTELTTAYDSGTADTDLMILVGTAQSDTVLLRAMADFYFPTEFKLVGDAVSGGLTDRIFESGEPDKLAALLQAIEDAYGPHDIPTGLMSEILELFVAAVRPELLNALNGTYVPDPDPGSTVPALADLVALLDDPDDPTDPEDYVGILRTPSRGKLAEMQKAITLAYGDNPVPATMFDELINAFNTFTPAGGLKDDIEAAITAKYQSELEVLGAETDTGFAALINNGGANVERFNYRNMEGLVVNTLAGDDHVATDDVIAATTINLGLGQDRAQVGQVFRSERVKDPQGELITGITAKDVFTTLEITRGWLSNGVSRPTTINGGDDNDQFTVFHNVAVLNLNGGDGDDLFTVRAFAMKGSTDSERARTDMKGDGGADTILYVVNAPVGIDGGDGFDTVRIVGTEFADDFVVTDSGVFGAGLNVTYVNIEKLVADGAEGDDRFFVQSTGLEVVTEIDGGLGSDSFFVGGNPSRAPVAVISNDFRGHSGVILHSVESGDAAWDGVPVEGVSANVGDDEEDFVLVRENGGSSRVVEGAAVGSGLGWEFDGYGVRLTRKPGPGQEVTLTVVPAGIAPEDESRGFKDLEFFAPSLSLLGPLGVPLGFNALTGIAIAPELKFNESNWDQLQYVRFRAAADAAGEGRRFVFINHTLQNSTDPDYRGAQMLSVKVQMEDNDRDGVIITSTDRGNTVLEDGPAAPGFTDSFDVVLAKQPTADVTVTMSVLNGQVTLSQTTLTFTPSNWNVRRTVTITAPDDAVIEGFHTDYVSFIVTSADTTRTVFQPLTQIDGDFDQLGVQAVPIDKPTSYVLLPHRPNVSQPVVVKVDGVQLPDGTIPFDPLNPLSGPARFAVSGNTLTFLAENGTPEFRIGLVEASYSHIEPGYHGTFVKDSVVDIYDEDAPTVIVEQLDDGSVDVIEGADTDQYRIRLSRAPAAGTEVKVYADAVDTRTTFGRTARFVEQVTVNGQSKTFVTFTSAAGSWDGWQYVTVTAVDDDFFDGNDTQVFAPDLQTVNKIRGPLILEGAAGAGSLSLPRPLMLPGELNVLEPDGFVQAFVASTGAGAEETMEVLLADLLAVVAELKADDSTITSIQDLVGKTLEMSKGPGTAIVLDETRPDDLYDRFWLINEVEDLGNGRVRLTLQNPTLVDPGQPNVTAPDATSQYAITALSVNFFADEREQVDYLFVFDEDSVADDRGALTSSDGAVFGFTPSTGATETMVVETAALQAVAKLVAGVPDVGLLAGRRLEITVGPGVGRAWTILGVADGPSAGTKLLTLARLAGGSGDPTDRSEFRIEGGDTHGRITGFGMGPNILFAGRPQPGGITYGDIEVVQMSLGSGDDEVRIDYATNAEDHTTTRGGDFYTLTLLDTGAGDDTVTVNLAEGQDGALALNLGAGDDTADGSASTAPLVVFGREGADHITGGSADDILFGDVGRVDYVKTVEVEVGGVVREVDEIVTRLGHSVPPNPVNPKVEGSTATTLFDADANFETAYGGLVGLVVQAISPQGHVQFRRIVANTADTLTIDRPWDQNPTTSYFYRVSALPEDQTDGVFRGPRIVWSIDESVGAGDTVNGGGGRDVILGGAADDVIDAGAGADWVAGDNARFDYEPISGGDGPTQLVLVVTTGVAFGGDDTIRGGSEEDVLIGGTEDDTIDGGTEQDVILGDQATVEFVDGRIARLEDPGTEGDDTLDGNADADLIVGGLGNDTMRGQGSTDILVGDAAEVIYAADGVTILQIRTIDRDNGGVDTLYGDGDEDVLIGGTNADNLDGGADDDLLFGDNVLLTLNPGFGDAIRPRFRALTGTTIYDANGLTHVGGPQAAPGGAPVWADWTITLDQDIAALGHYGDDYLAGGAHDDQIFGQFGDDIIQGDASIGGAPVGAGRVNSLLQVAASFEAATDGDDYVEGNGGSDVIFGNLGQDDLIGGSSSLFSLTAAARRPDEDDLIFGGAGTDLARNDPGDTATTGHARDADVIAGDNANIYRLVGVNNVAGASYLAFNYDNYGTLRIIPRALELLDYTSGGPDYNAAASALDLGAADELHGESGDDVLHGMRGDDVLYGEGQDDDLYGGYGADWISGGTGDDGVLGDDGRISTSRNGATEPLYGLLAPTAQQTISTPGNIQQAVINVTGQLKKTVNLTPFNVDPQTSDQDPLFDPAHADDIIYGGWGMDFLHGGSGDDAISGAEALPASSADADAAINYDRPTNPGDVLRYGKVRAGEFAAYDEFNPLGKVAQFLLNFSAAEGSLVAGSTTVRTDGDDRIFGDLGNDWVVGGTGRDDAYGGWGDDLLNVDDDLDTNGGLNTAPDTHPTYEDRAYGGADRDVLVGNTGGDRLIDWVGEFNSFIVPFAPFGAAAVSRTLQPQLAEFLYALSASDGADPTRAADTGTDPARNGEPEGELGLIRQQDFAWQEQTGGPTDPQAGNIPGGPRDILRSASFNEGSMAGFAPDSGSWTVQGGALQVAAASLGRDAVSVYHVGEALPGYFEVQASVEVIKPTAGWKANAYLIFDYNSKTDFKFAGIDVSVNKLVMGHRDAAGWHVDRQAPFQAKPDTYYNLLLAINGLSATLVVDNVAVFSHSFAPRVIDGYSYALNWGLVGVGSDNSRGSFDNVRVQVLPPQIAFEIKEDFADGRADLFTPQTGGWSAADGRYAGTPSGGSALTTMSLRVEPLSFLEFQGKVTAAAGGLVGLVFDSYGPTDFKFAGVLTTTGEVVIGHRRGDRWVIDKAVNRGIVAGTEYLLGISLKGTTASVTLNGQAVVGHAFNALVVDGKLGLFTRDAAASFDDVVVRGDDPNYETQLAAGPAAPGADAGPALTYEALAPVAAEAVRRWSEATGVASGPVHFYIVDLGGLTLGQAAPGVVFLDADAAGHGWFVDPTPGDDVEFAATPNGTLAADPNGPAYGRMDLLTVLMHELGHQFGLPDLDPVEHAHDLMGLTLATGLRRVAEPFPFDGIASGGSKAPTTTAPADARPGRDEVTRPLLGRGSRVGEQDVAGVPLDERALQGLLSSLVEDLAKKRRRPR